ERGKFTWGGQAKVFGTVSVYVRVQERAGVSYEQSLEIKTLKHTLSDHLKEKESLEQKITILKNDFQKEESRNIDRELALEKQVKELSNIGFKRNQSAQTVHMLTKPQFFNDHTTRQALGFQNPCYLKRAQQLKPKLYDGSVIEKSDSIVVHDPEETLFLAKEMQPEEPNLSASTTIVEVPKELPKVILLNSSLKKLKFHLASFDMVDLFNSFDQFLIDELSEVQQVFKQMEQAIEQHSVMKHKFQNKMKNVLQENDRLLTQALSVDIVNIIVHDTVKSACMNVDVCDRCVTIESELKKDFIKKDCYETLFQKLNTLEKHCISLEAQAKDTIILKLKEKLHSLSGDVNERNVKREVEEIKTLNIELDHKVTKLVAENEHLKQTYKQLYDSIKSSRVRSKEQCDDLINKVNLKSAEVSNLNASLQEKVLVITALKETISNLKGKKVVTEVISLILIDPELLKIDVAPLASKLHKNRTAHTDYIRHTQEEAATLREIIESERLLNPLNTSLDYA
nr:Gag-Pol polyprotein [Tanacetum cinerariifolium]